MVASRPRFDDDEIPSSCPSPRALGRGMFRARRPRDGDGARIARDGALRLSTRADGAKARGMELGRGETEGNIASARARAGGDVGGRRAAMRVKLGIGTPRALRREFREGEPSSIETEAEAEGDAPAFVRKPRDALGRPRPTSDVCDVYRLSDAASSARFDPSSLWTDENALRGEFQKQFWSIKSGMMDCVVMIRHGSFYNMFDVDADAGTAVGLRLTGGNAGFMRKVGCRVESFDEWAARLLASGRTVARVEQMEEAAKPGAVINRECCEILTPAIDRGLTLNEGSSFFLAIAEDESTPNRFGACAMDVQSGKAALGALSLEELLTVLVQYEPREVVISESLGDDARRVLVAYSRASEFANVPLRVLERGGAEVPTICGSDVLRAVKHFHEDHVPLEDTLAHASDIELRAVFFAMRHLSWCGIVEDVFARVTFENMMPISTEPTELRHGERLSAFALARDLNFMKLDGEAIKSLHILTGDTGKIKGSLFSFLNNTTTSPGRRRLRQWLIRPLRQVSAIEARLDVVQELSSDHYTLQMLRGAMKRLKSDYERLFTKSCRLAIKCSKVYNIVRFNQSLTRDVDDMGLSDVAPKGAHTLEEILLEAVNMVSFWEMHKRELMPFVQSLDSLIDICDVASVIGHLVDRNVSIASLFQDLDGVRDFVRQLRSSLVVTAMSKKSFIVTPSPEVFVEYGEAAQDAMRERNMDPIARRQSERMRKELRRIYIPLSDDDEERDADEQDAADRADLAAANAFTELMQAFREEIPRFERVVSAMCDLDVLQSFATTCASSRGVIGFTRPEFSSASFNLLELNRSWHPLLKPSIVDDAKGITHERGIVDNDVSMKVPFILLTGPNMSGKSSLLRQIAIAVILAQMGCLVPAASCKLSVADAVMTRIGGDDNLANGVSTFLNEMHGAAKIMKELTPSTLIIFDELGRGTSTLDGYAIAFAVSRYLISGALKPRTLFATHYHELIEDLSRVVTAENAFVSRHIGVQNIGRTLRMMYKLEPGAAPLGSCALNVARLAGFPPGILTRASHVAQTVNFSRNTQNGAASTYEPPEALLTNDEHVAFSLLVSDPAVVGDAEALGDGVSWAREFHRLWKRCRELILRVNEP